MWWLRRGAPTRPTPIKHEPEGFDQIASGDRSGLAWLKGHRFVSEEVFELDSDPRGKVLRAEDALDQLDMFRMSQEATPEPDHCYRISSPTC